MVPHPFTCREPQALTWALLGFESSVNNCLVVSKGLGRGGFSMGWIFGSPGEASFLLMGPHCLDTATHLNTDPGQAERVLLSVVACHKSSAF